MDLAHLMDNVMDFCKWQAQDTGTEVIIEPLPDDLPIEIMADEKWLHDDLLCVASNAIKYSRASQASPVTIRVAVEHPMGSVENIPVVRFSVTDTGYPLSDDKLKHLFDRPSHVERMMTGGMGLGLFCLSEHVSALQVPVVININYDQNLNL